MTVVNYRRLLLSSNNQPKGKKERTREKIFNTAISLFLEQGYENTTVQQITEKADVAKGTFFSHFPTKDAILTYLGEQRVELMKENLTNELIYIHSAKEQILSLFELLAKASEENKKMTKLISHQIINKLNSPELEHETENQLELKSILASILANGQQSGEFKKDFQPGHVADILIGIYFLSLFQWLSTDLPISLTNEYRDRVSIVLGGIMIGHS